MRILAALVVCISLLMPLIAKAEPKDPWNYPLKQYGFLLATAIVGGLVSWFAKVRTGQAQAWNVMQLIGELCTSAFAGLIAFWLCEYANAPALLTASLVGIAGHMGTRAITAFEEVAQRRWGVSVRKQVDLTKTDEDAKS